MRREHSEHEPRTALTIHSASIGMRLRSAAHDECASSVACSKRAGHSGVRPNRGNEFLLCAAFLHCQSLGFSHLLRTHLGRHD
jgi:hypothetical protein